MRNAIYRLGCALGLCAGAALAGCGGSTAPYVSPNGGAPSSAARSATPFEPYEKTLLYATGALNAPNKLYEFSYPGARFVGAVSVPNRPQGLCADQSGNIFVTTIVANSGDSYVYEYAHGVAQPIATLTDPGEGNSCAIDPSTGDLAVANWSSGSPSTNGDVAIYRNARGTPRTFTAKAVSAYLWCAYDDAGDLFVDGIDGKHVSYLVELSKGANSFEKVSLDRRIAPSSLQWLDGRLLVAGDASMSGPEHVYRVEVAANKGTIVGSTTLESRQGMNSWGGEFVVEGGHVAGPSYPRRFLSTWSYPKGGPALRYVGRAHVKEFYGFAISATH